MKKQFIAPRITKVVNEELMAGVCNEQFIYTSKGGASNGYANVCYHYRINIDDKLFGYKISEYGAIVVSLPKNAVFDATPDVRDDKRTLFNPSDPLLAGSYLLPSELGWRDFQGLNGNCHFIGDIYINGELLTPENASHLLK
jgi:nitrite reductase/ring-hydroxylating ferredoxin subunit